MAAFVRGQGAGLRGIRRRGGMGGFPFRLDGAWRQRAQGVIGPGQQFIQR